MDQLADKGVLFENAFSPVPLTLPSHASILTGTYPTFHGIRNNGTYALSEHALTVGEILKSQGYTTAAFVSSYILDKRFNLDQGFDIYDDNLSMDKKQTFYHKERSAEAVTQAAVQWFKKTNPERFFLWVHYFDPHMHYRPPRPYSEIYAENLYDGEIAYTDHCLGMLLDALDESGKAEDTVIIVTGDHGESLGEHKEKTHGIFIYDATLRVPLIITSPKLFPASKRINNLVRLVDIAPTILNIAGYTPHKDIQGISLFPLMLGKENNLNLTLYCESYYPRFSHNWSPLVGLRTKRWKYIEAPCKELYRIDNDPQETENIIDQEKGEAERFEARLSHLKGHLTSTLAKEKAQSITLDEKARQKLNSLGYIFSPASTHKKEGFPDPKQKIGLLEDIDQGMAYFGKGEFQKAIESFITIIRKYPNDVDAYTVLGHIYEATGKYEKAIEAYQGAIKRGCKDPRTYIKLGSLHLKGNHFKEGEAILCEALNINSRSIEAYIIMAEYFLQKKEFDQALIQFQRALEITPGDVNATSNAAAIYLKQKKYNEAITACHSILSRVSNDTSVLFTLGSALYYTHKYEESSNTFERIFTIEHDSASVHYMMGLLRFRQNRFEEAIGHFKKVIQMVPDWAEAHFNLGLLYHKRKKVDQAISSYKIAVRLKPELRNEHEIIDEADHQISMQSSIF